MSIYFRVLIKSFNLTISDKMLSNVEKRMGIISKNVLGNPCKMEEERLF